ncbi:MAG: hypothetical protein PHE83_12295 [Opitutaceae bacterium]|nr:hypothetical protein [Opitutaceae bacterium]
MSPRLEAITREARRWLLEHRLALARRLLDLNQGDDLAEMEAARDEEIRARVLAIEEGRAIRENQQTNAGAVSAMKIVILSPSRAELTDAVSGVGGCGETVN